MTKQSSDHHPIHRAALSSGGNLPRLLVAAALVVALVVSQVSPVSAEPPGSVDVTLESISYDGLGVTVSSATAAGWTLRTSELQATATVACDGCGPLNGATVAISQQLGIVVVGDVLTPVIRGRSNGEVELTVGSTMVSRSFAGQLGVTLLDAAGECFTLGGCDVAIVLASEVQGSGHLDMELVANLRLGGATPAWTSIAGTGVGRIVIDVIHAG